MRTPTAVKSSLHSLQGKTLDYVTQKLGLPDEVSSIGKNQLFVFKKEDGDWHCSVKLLIDENEIVKKVDISANTVYLCPAG